MSLRNVERHQCRRAARPENGARPCALDDVRPIFGEGNNKPVMVSASIALWLSMLLSSWRLIGIGKLTDALAILDGKANTVVRPNMA